jgi:hypothetical protein
MYGLGVRNLQLLSTYGSIKKSQNNYLYYKITFQLFILM